MPQRFAHMLGSVNDGGWPYKIIVGQIDRYYLPSEFRKGELIPQIAGWRLQEVYRRDNIVVDGEQRSGVDTASFWEQIVTGLRYRKTNVLILDQAIHSLSLAGFWDLLDDGLDAAGPPLDTGKTPILLLKQGKWRGKLVVDNPPTVIDAKCKTKVGTLRIMDSQNWGIIPATERLDCAAKFDRLINDVTSWLQLVKGHKLGPFKCTLASQSMAAFRHRLCKKPLWIHNNVFATRLERDALHGGRCECLTLGRVPEKSYYCDAFCNYTSLAYVNEVPVRLEGYSGNSGADLSALCRPGYCVIAEVLVSTSYPRYPYRRGTDLIFPVGQFWTALPGPELALALETDCVRQVGRVAYYQSARLFEPWAKEMLELRERFKQEGKTTLYNQIRALANSLYGKFAQVKWGWTDVREAISAERFDFWYAPLPEDQCGQLAPGEIPTNPWDVEAVNDTRMAAWRSICGRVQCEITFGECINTLPAITAWINSLARVRLLERMQIAGWGNIHYVDTDCLICNQRGYDNLVKAGEFDTTRPGYLRLKGSYERLTITGIKSYSHECGKASAGVPRQTTMADEQTGTFAIAEGVNGALRKHDQPNTSLRLVRRQSRGIYRHGLVTVSGRVSPLGVFESGDLCK